MIYLCTRQITMLTTLMLIIGIGEGIAANAPCQNGKGNEKKEQTMEARALYSRDDLKELKQLDRDGIFRALGSFDDAGMTEADFAVAVAGLLDETRIPNLTKAVAHADPKAIAAAVMAACLQRHPTPTKKEVTPEIIARADAVYQHRFTFYEETHQLPDSIDWDFNPGTAHWGHDLNRFSYLPLLTATYLGTDDPKYAGKTVSLMLDWITKSDISQCFIGTPYVFGSYLNNTIHCGVWAHCLEQLIPCGQVQPDALLRILKSLHDQLAYLEIVTNKHKGNWPTIGFSGMLNVLAAFPFLRDTERFIDYCIDNMAIQIAEQVLPDGVQDELTPHYHRCVIGNILTVQKGLRKLNRTLSPKTLATLRQMVEYYQHCLTPDGKLEVGFNDSDPETVAQLFEPLAALGLEDFFLPSSALKPRMFPYAGTAFLRQQAADGDLYLAFDGGPYGRSHQHADKLSFVLHAYGRTFIVDPGRHLYDWSQVSFYGYLRSTSAHSTLMIDGEGQDFTARPDLFIAKEPLDLGWQVTEHEVRASAAYEQGYGSKHINVIHRREIVFVEQRFWVIFDRVEGDGEHLVESHFQFYPGELMIDGTDAYTTYPDANLLLRTVPSSDWEQVKVECGEKNPHRGWYSASYGKIEPAPSLNLSTTTPLPFSSATILFPWQGDTTLRPKIETTWHDNELEITTLTITARVKTTLGESRGHPPIK